jgi:hypoxanthine-guanine phosphoribosyltransferase
VKIAARSRTCAIVEDILDTGEHESKEIVIWVWARNPRRLNGVIVIQTEGIRIIVEEGEKPGESPRRVC